jgi:MATE family multidrug resistance protein
VKTILSNYTPYFKKIAWLSYPIIIGQIGFVLMGVADVIMIGRIDATNLAAAGLANSIFFLVAIIGIGTLMAVSSLTAQAKGAGNNDQCATFFKQGILSSIILSVCISTILFVVALNMSIFKQNEQVTELASQFLNLLNLGTLPLLLFTALKQFSDGLSFTKSSAVITIIALIINVELNWLLIFGNWGFPKFGLAGAGYATLIARIFMAFCMAAFVLLHSQYKPFLHFKEKVNELKIFIEIFQVGLPSGFQYFFEIAAFSASGIIIGWIGKEEQASHHIALNIASITYMISTGISAAGSILVGDALGRKNKTDLIRSGKSALILAAIFMASCAIILAVFSNVIVGLYIDDILVSKMAIYLIFIAAFFQLSDGIQCVSLGILRGIEDTKIPTLVTIISYWIIGIPIGYVLAFNFGMSLYGIWIGLLIGLTFSASMLSWRFIRLSKRMNLSMKVNGE